MNSPKTTELDDILKSLMEAKKAVLELMPDTSKVTRFEVIDHSETGEGRILVKRDVKVELSFQDDDRTLKVFVKKVKV